MDLWIRSQNKDSLIKAEKIELIYDYLCTEDIQLIHIETDKGRIGSYSTQERALEVLDDIQNKMNPKYFYKKSCLMKPEETEKMETNLQQKHNADFIVGFASDEIEPLSNDVLVYEMPEE